jgi:hypothetical protein
MDVVLGGQHTVTPRIVSQRDTAVMLEFIAGVFGGIEAPPT